MKRSKWVERSFVACVVCCFAPLAWVAAEDESAPRQAAPEPLFTFPSDRRNLSFPEMGLVQKLLVKPGDVVKKGDLLATEDTDEEEIQYRAMRIEAESTADIDAAVADHASKMLVYQRLQKAAEATNPTEIEEAKLAADVADIKIRDAKEQREEKLAELAKEGKKIDRMHLFSPVDGIVEKISVFPGEVTDPVKADGVLTIVANQPMWADMHLLTAQAAKLKMGDAVQVAYENDPSKWFDAKVIYFDPVADAASDKQTVRIQWDNSEGKPAGLAMNVRLPSMNQTP
jgi:RND family efflux transporter MFP subunit